MRINNNMMAMNTHRQLGTANADGAKSMEKLSSGFRINRAGDDAAGLSISEKMRGQIRGLNQASSNAQDGISMIQTAEGALNETHAILQRMRELSVQASNDPNNDDDRQAIGQELKDLTDEIDRISKTTAFNGKKLVDGSLATTQNSTSGIKEGVTAGTGSVISKVDVSGALAGTTYTVGTYVANELTLERGDGLKQTVNLAATAGDTQTLNFSELGISIEITGTTAVEDIGAALATKTIITTSGNSAAQFAIGANGVADEKMTVSFGKFDATTLGTAGAKLNTLISASNAEDIVKTATLADGLTKTLDDSIKQVSEQRSKLGAAQNRLEHTIKNLDNTSENLQAAEARIRDVDMAKEMMEQTKQNILAQASTAMLANANQAPQAVLQLLR